MPGVRRRRRVFARERPTRLRTGLNRWVLPGSRFSVSRAETIRLMKWKDRAVPTYAAVCRAKKGSGVRSGWPGTRVASPQATMRACTSFSGVPPRARRSARAWSPVACSRTVCASTQNGHLLARDTPSAASSLPVRLPSPASSDSRINAQVAARSSGADDRTTKVTAPSMPKSSESCR